ncbi:response regulator [Pelagovum pacificum]|uniref:Response regulator n=1 Tax=Pelagovum pacificum TaxID=2588711 RepID=A0A5C5GM21_9RHOB|nr:response regulator [Pelagovum pacificum]TNY34336.1 response regulator [Pelagovum pacificum]
MICEDEAIVALDLKMLVEEVGYDVLGPFPSVASANRSCDEPGLRVAILDVRLRDGEVFPLADKLRDRGVGLIFHSGHALSGEISDRFPDAQFCPKPLSTSRLTESLHSLARREVETD